MGLQHGCHQSRNRCFGFHSFTSFISKINGWWTHEEEKAMTEKVKAALKASKKLDEKAKLDVLELLGQLEGELQAKDIAIATLKSECLKHLLHNLRSDKSLLCDPSLALNRDSCKGLKNSSKTGGLASAKATSANDQTAHKLVALCDLVESQKNTLQRLTHCLSEADKQRCDLLKDLEEERLKNEELAKVVLSASSPLEDDTLKPIIDSTDTQVQTDSFSDSNSEELQQLKTTLATERKRTKEMILVLMEDRRKMATLYMEEKKRSEDLSRQLRDEKSKNLNLGMGLEEESKRSLAMEAELERHLVQINSQAEELQKPRINAKEFEDALRKARTDAEHFKKQLSEAHRVAMSQATAAAAPLYAAHSEALSAASVSSSMSNSSSISASNSSMGASSGGLTVSSLVTAAMAGAGKQSMQGYDSFSTSQVPPNPVAKSRTSISSTSTMVARGGHRVVPNVTGSAVSTVSDNNMNSTITRLTNSFQVNGISKKVGGGVAPPVPPNKPTVSIYKPLAKLEGIVNSSDAAK